MTDDRVLRLEEYGALPSQLVDLADGESPRTLRYVDLLRAPSADRPPVVFEAHGQPRAYVFDAPSPDSSLPVQRWIRRVALRGDADWVAVLRPGRLDVFRAVLDGSDAPQPVQGLPDKRLLFPSLLHAQTAGVALGLRGRLLELLRRSIVHAKRLGVSSHDALSLVGRGLFWRFLIDRGLLEGLKRDDVCPNARTWPECLSTKSNALTTFAWLNETFNGGLLPFESSPRSYPAEAFQDVVGNVAHLATADGQLSLRLPNDWSEVNFAHVPVGLLSEVYEAYAHGEDSSRAKAESIFYTPRHIAEFLVEEALDASGDLAEPRVLDPAAGAGVFLVATFRALVAREWSRSGRRPSRKAVRRILNEQLTGLDINDSALRLAELALYLTAIELDPEQTPRPLSLLRFEELRGRALIQVPGGATAGSLGPVEERFRSSFDIVVGNPPWTASSSGAAKKKWVAATRAVVESRLGRERAAEFDFADANPDLPFVYRAMEWAKAGGSIALVTHARWLFAQTEKAIRARRDLLESVHVTGVLNGAELRDTSVWPNVRHPFCLLFAKNEPAPARAALLFISPKLDRIPDADQDRIRVDWQDAREIEVREIVSRPWILKVRFRGTPFDEAVLEELQGRGTRLGDYLGTLGTGLKNGYKVGGEKGKKQSADALRDLRDLKGTDPGFLIDTDVLPRFKRSSLLRPRSPAIYRAPLLIVHESMRADRLVPRAALSLAGVAFDERFDGASFAGIDNGHTIASYLQLVIQSAVFQHALLMLDGQFGIEREVVHLSTLEAVPVVPFHGLTAAQRSRSSELSARLHKAITPELLTQIDDFVADVYRLTLAQRAAVADALGTALPTAGAKAEAVRPTGPAEREEFAATCEQALRDVLRASRQTAFVRVQNEPSGFWRILQIDRVADGQKPPRLASLDARRFIEAADDASASLVVLRIDEHTTVVGLLDRYRYWTSTRARILAASLLSEPDAHGRAA